MKIIEIDRQWQNEKRRMKFNILQKIVDPAVDIGLHFYHLLKVKVAHSVDFLILIWVITHSSSGQIVSRCYAYSIALQKETHSHDCFLLIYLRINIYTKHLNFWWRMIYVPILLLCWRISMYLLKADLSGIQKHISLS